MPDSSQPNDARLCATCGKPLLPHSGRGRPQTTHADECRHLRRNRMQLQARIARYLAAAGPVAIDRSDLVRGAMPESAVDSSDIHGDEALLGGIAQPFNPIYLPGRALMEAVRKHEENHATTALLAEHREGIDPQLRAKVALIPSVPYEEYRALLRRRPGAAASPAFLEYEARREEIHEAEREYLLLMAAARDAKPTRKRARPTTGN